MNELFIRPAKEGDVKAIENMIYKWIRWRRERADTIMKALRDENHQILVAEFNDQVVGVLQQIFYLDILNGGYNSHINFLLVDEEHRGKGIGSQLLEKAVGNAKKKGILEIHVDTIYEEAAKFYKKHGFKDSGVMLELSL